MTFRRQWWLLIPLAAAVGCAGAQQAQQPQPQKTAQGNSTLVDEGPATGGKEGAVAGAAGAAAQPANAQNAPPKLRFA